MSAATVAVVLITPTMLRAIADDMDAGREVATLETTDGDYVDLEVMVSRNDSDEYCDDCASDA